MQDTILVTRSSMPSFEEYLTEISPLWQSHWLTNMGEKHRTFESLLQDFLGVPEVRLFTNGHLALECMLEAMRLPKGEKVITTPFTFASTTHAIVRKGLVPVFADVKPDDLTIDPQSVERLAKDGACAILAVHVYGNPCDDVALKDIAGRYGLGLYYDAAHAFGVKAPGGIAICNLGDASMLSFHATKVFNTVEGGAVCLPRDANRDLAQALEHWRNFGIEGPEDVVYAGGNAKMDELRAAMGICNLRHVEENIAARVTLDARYRERLEAVPGLFLPQPAKGTVRNYAYLPVLFKDSFGATRDEVADALKAHGIFARKYFYPLTSSYECYKGRFDPHDTPVALDAAGRVLTLPLYPDLPIQVVDSICDVVVGCRR